MKIFKWIVQINHDPGTFFPTVSSGRYVCGVEYDGAFGCMVPVFGEQNPVLYSRRAAWFLVKEFRRVGYCVNRRPYLLYAIRQRKALKAASPWK